MTSYPQGKISATPGTPVQLSAAPNGLPVCAIMLSQIAGTTGNVYFGKTGVLVKATLVGCIRQFMPPAASGFLDSEEIGDWSSNTLDPTQYCVDNDNSSQGMLVTYFQM